MVKEMGLGNGGKCRGVWVWCSKIKPAGIEKRNLREGVEMTKLMGVFSFQRGSRTATTHKALPVSGAGSFSPATTKRRFGSRRFLICILEVEG